MVLQECGADALPVALRHKTRVIFQSTTAQEAVVKPTAPLRMVMVGHLRDEKWPQTLFEAARRLLEHPDILIDHIGDALDPELGAQASACMRECPQYRWWRIPGDVGMLGADYAGYFALGDAPGLADLLLRCRAQMGQANEVYAQLSRQCALRAPLSSPATEQAAVLALVKDLLHANT